MTKQEINLVISTSLGWEPSQYYADGSIRLYKLKNHEQYESLERLPNYCKDLNAIHKLEDALHSKRDEQNQYVNELQVIVYRTKHSGQSIEFAMLNASALQRAEAYVMLINKYKG